MKLAPLVLPLLLVAPLPVQAQALPSVMLSADPATLADCRKLLDNYLSLLLTGDKPDPAPVQGFIAGLSPEGNWPDIDYADHTLSNWKPLRHMDRVSALFLALRQPGTPLYNDARVKEAAFRSLNWWLLNKPKESQWYHLNISVPRKMRDIILLAGDDLQGDQRALAMKQLEQFKVGGTGANLVWSADLAMHDAALRGDGQVVGEMSKTLSDEIKVSDFEGIRDDWSFHQHGPRLQTFHYGQSYFSESTRIAWQLRDTRWAYPAAKTDLLANLALQGWSWQLRGNQTVPSTLDRAVSREGALQVKQIVNLRRLAQVSPKYSQQLQNLISNIEAGLSPARGFKWFPRSDFAAYQTPAASLFIKTVSDRSNTTESINGENQLGAQLNLGNQFILKTGDEYFDLMVAWDWKRLPGVTWPEWAGVRQPTNTDRETTVLRQPFSGAVTDGSSGAVAWQEGLQSQDKTRDFSVRKSTFINGNLAISLWSDLKSSGDGAAVTTLEQNRWRGDIWGGTVNTTRPFNAQDNRPIEETGLDWVNHNRTGYIALQPQGLSVSAEQRNGSWKSINNALSDKVVTDPVFTAWMPSQTQGGYVTVLDADYAATRALAAAPTWKVIVQTPEVQAVCFLPAGTIMAAFFAPGQIPGGWSVDRTCLLLFDGRQLFASDPLQKGGPLHLSLGKQSVTVELPKDGNSVMVVAPELAFSGLDELLYRAAKVKLTGGLSGGGPHN